MDLANLGGDRCYSNNHAHKFIIASSSKCPEGKEITQHIPEVPEPGLGTSKGASEVWTLP